MTSEPKTPHWEAMRGSTFDGNAQKKALLAETDRKGEERERERERGGGERESVKNLIVKTP